MASGFSGEKGGSCEGFGCQSVFGLAYSVKEIQKFCDDCATKSGSARKVKTNEIAIFCEQHDKSVKLFCQHHEIAVCQVCAIKDHQKPCQLEDVHAVLANKRSQLLNLKSTLRDKQLIWKRYSKKVSECKQGSDSHIKSVESEVNYIIDCELDGSRAIETHTAKQINDEADEEIRKITEEINKKREARLNQCQEEAEKNQQPIESKRRELLDDVRAITDTTHNKIHGLQCDTRDVMKRVDDATEKVEILFEDDKELLNGAQQLITSITDTLGKRADEDVVDHITRTVRGVRFIEGAGNEKYNGRIGGYDGKWELCRSGYVPDDILKPFIVGHTSNDEIIMSDIHSNSFHTYCHNIKNGTFRRVITSDNKTGISSCAMLDENTIVCGKYVGDCSTSDSLAGGIRLYNGEWKLIREITLPRNTLNNDTCFGPWAYAAVGQNGMIIAAECFQKCLHVINPCDGCIVNTIRCEEDIGVLRGVLSTGDVIAHPGLFSNKLLIIDSQGAQREITHSEEIQNCVIDPLTDDLYVVHWDEERKMAVIDQLSGEVEQEKAEVIAFPLHPIFKYNIMSFLASSCHVLTTSGDMVVSNGREYLVFTKKFTL